MSSCNLSRFSDTLKPMTTKNADKRLKILKHVTEMLLIISDNDEDMTDAELETQYNDAEEWADLLLESIGFTITDTTGETITATLKLEDIEAFLDAKAEEYVVADNLE